VQTIRRILHPTDFTEASAAAFRFACALARDYGAGLTVLYVCPPPISLDDVADRQRPGGLDDELVGRLYELKPADRSLVLDYRLGHGDPATVILDTAAHGCDLIVMGTHGRSGLRRVIMGSVAAAVSQKAPCPVVTVRGGCRAGTTPPPSQTGDVAEAASPPEAAAPDLGVGDPARAVRIPAGSHTMSGTLHWSGEPRGVVVFVRGGEDRHGLRGEYDAGVLTRSGFATLLIDLLDDTEAGDPATASDVALLADRLLVATDWLAGQPVTAGLTVGYFGAGVGTAAALLAAAGRPGRVAAVVSGGGRPDLVWDKLPAVRAPTLLIAGAEDQDLADLNRRALERLAGPKEMALIPGSTHRFPEPGAIEEPPLALRWFRRYLSAAAERAPVVSSAVGVCLAGR
jgi:nucleotide-binding universal stress UspA family protein/dienelactone hydrolase